MQNGSNKMMAVACGRKYQAIASFNRMPGLDAGQAGISTQQCVGRCPCISMMLCGSGKPIGPCLHDLCKERYGHGIACQMDQVCSRCVMIWIGTIGSVNGQAIGIEVMCLEQVQMVRKEVHTLHKVL